MVQMCDWFKLIPNPGSFLLHDNHASTTDGRVALYMKSDYSYLLRSNLKIDSIENIWIESNETIVGVIYELPNDSNTISR